MTGARGTDPETSHEAAASLDEEFIRRTQTDVLWLFARHGAMTDRELVVAHREAAEAELMRFQSDSGIRTRRSELVRRGTIYDTGRRTVLPSGRRAIVWSM